MNYVFTLAFQLVFSDAKIVKIKSRAIFVSWLFPFFQIIDFRLGKYNVLLMLEREDYASLSPQKTAKSRKALSVSETGKGFKVHCWISNMISSKMYWSLIN
jgi:hypothetical protein